MIAKWDQSVPADLDVFGHFHQYIDGGKWMCNGTFAGYSPFAVSLGASFAPPQQAFFLVEAERGKTITSPIFLE
jgi:hypothetical protein